MHVISIKVFLRFLCFLIFSCCAVLCSSIGRIRVRTMPTKISSIKSLLYHITTKNNNKTEHLIRPWTFFLPPSFYNLWCWQAITTRQHLQNKWSSCKAVTNESSSIVLPIVTTLVIKKSIWHKFIRNIIVENRGSLLLMLTKIFVTIKHTKRGEGREWVD